MGPSTYNDDGFSPIGGIRLWDYDRPNKRTKRGGELDGGRKRAGINDQSAATKKIWDSSSDMLHN